MKALYYVMLIGLAVAFFTIILSAAAMLMPTGIDPNNTVVAIPNNVMAGTLVKYKINGCEEGKHSGVTSVNIQSVDSPPSITVAVAAPAAQSIHCQNVILVPSPLPSGEYRLIVFISYEVNPVRNLLNPERRQYTSNIINVTNENPRFKLPEALPAPITEKSERQMEESSPSVQTEKTPTEEKTPEAQESPRTETMQTSRSSEPESPSIIQRLITPLTNIQEEVL